MLRPSKWRGPVSRGWLVSSFDLRQWSSGPEGWHGLSFWVEGNIFLMLGNNYEAVLWVYPSSHKPNFLLRLTVCWLFLFFNDLYFTFGHYRQTKWTSSTPLTSPSCACTCASRRLSTGCKKWCNWQRTSQWASLSSGVLAYATAFKCTVINGSLPMESYCDNEHTACVGSSPIKFAYVSVIVDTASRFPNRLCCLIKCSHSYFLKHSVEVQ